MFRRASRSRLDRFLAAVEVAALGLWIGALCGFAFVTAPATFRTVSDPGQIARLTTATLETLADVGYGCGGLAIVAAVVRARDASEPRSDLLRAGLVLIALGLVAYLSVGIIPAMVAIPDVHSAAFGALHLRSTLVYGGVVVLGFIALVMTAARVDV